MFRPSNFMRFSTPLSMNYLSVFSALFCCYRYDIRKNGKLSQSLDQFVPDGLPWPLVWTWGCCARFIIGLIAFRFDLLHLDVTRTKQFCDDNSINLLKCLFRHYVVALYRLFAHSLVHSLGQIHASGWHNIKSIIWQWLWLSW